MKTKLRNRYYCEFCPKAGQSAYHMRRHESGCTMNPDRVCKMCPTQSKAQKPIAELLAALELDYERHELESKDLPVWEYVASKVIPRELRKVADGCPACMLAAIRQNGYVLVEFDFRDEAKAWWDSVNIEYERECLHG